MFVGYFIKKCFITLSSGTYSLSHFGGLTRNSPRLKLQPEFVIKSNTWWTLVLQILQVLNWASPWYGLNLFFLAVSSLFSLTFRPPPSVLLVDPAFQGSGTITWRQENGNCKVGTKLDSQISPPVTSNQTNSAVFSALAVDTLCSCLRTGNTKALNCQIL